jgi:hypothetical protein
LSTSGIFISAKGPRDINAGSTMKRALLGINFWKTTIIKEKTTKKKSNKKMKEM